jgi:hypothetical protein
MSNCAICSTKLKFTNTPTFGSGKLSGGEVVCTNCYKQINNANPKVAFKLKKHTLSEVKELIQTTFGDIDAIKEQIKSLPIDNVKQILKRKEIKEISRIIAENEKLDNIIQGIYNNGIGILISTNRRLVFIDKGLLYGLKVEDFPLDKISSIQYETGLLMGKLKIHTSGNIAVIDNVEKGSVRKFAEFVRDKIENKTSENNSNQVTENKEPDIMDKLEKLGKLRDNGILTEEEFNEQKAKLLSQM